MGVLDRDGLACGVAPSHLPGDTSEFLAKPRGSEQKIYYSTNFILPGIRTNQNTTILTTEKNVVGGVKIRII